MASQGVTLLVLCLFSSVAQKGYAARQAPFVELCIRTLTSDAGAGKADLRGLAGTAVKAAAKSGANTSEYIAGLLNGQVEDPSLQQCLSDCSDSYVDAVEQLEDSVAALDSGGFADAKTWVAVAVVDTETCREG
ncbi:unnamed protein product [Spirodela intermedia]|uniref:Pectinesterase inhibitor domain-containing protein n=1 Tax=Spirodela intermedia TaxID=51605 RepID=A0A7I8IVK1_SPIIN|nr:unnamed protein product [Spirodela intermedia]CAA6662017.1 unnamed protein product [Spirodela intermedia]